MEISKNWLPLTEYALRNGISISTLRRKIKANAIEYKMEEGRYLIRCDEAGDTKGMGGFASSDQLPARQLAASSTRLVAQPIPASAPLYDFSEPASLEDLERIREQILRIQEDNLLRWKALEARVAGLAKKLDFFTEQMAETKMLIKIFEEKLDGRA